MAILSKIKSAASKVASTAKKVASAVGVAKAVTSAVRSASASKTSSVPKTASAISSLNLGSSPKSSSAGDAIAKITGGTVSTKTGGATTPSRVSKSLDVQAIPGSMSKALASTNSRTSKDLAVAAASPATSPYFSQKSSVGGSTSTNSLSRSGVYNAPVSTSVVSPYTSTRSSSSTVSSPLTAGSTTMGATGGSMQGKLPQTPGPTNFTGLSNNYSTLTGVTNIDGTQTDTTGTAQEAPNAQAEALMKLAKEFQPQEPERIDREKIMKEVGLTQALKEQQKLANQISAITAQKEAQLLQLRGVAGAEGVTEAVYGGQQAQIERETAIKLLPLTAQYEAASGNVQAAKELVANFIADENNYQSRLYQHQQSIYNKVWDYATDQQKTALEEKRRKEDRQYQMEKDFRSEQNKLAELDIENTGGKNLSRIFGAQNYDELDSVYQRVNVSTAPSGSILTDAGKPMNDTQATSYGYAQRLVEADAIISQIGDQFTALRSYAGQLLPNILKTDDRQRFEQAQRNFINSVLRKESGAVISEEEFKNARQQYFPQPGDSDAVLQQKAQNRDTVIENFYRQAGVSAPMTTVTTTPEDLRTKYNY